MSLILYNFKCDSCNHLEEVLVKSNIISVECAQCGQLSPRQISTPTIKLDGTDPGFPTAYDKWARVHEQAGKG